MKRIFIFISFITITDYVFAQGAEDKSFSLPNIIMPSPDAYSLGKFGEFPVNKYTGTVNTNLPIYTIDIEGFSLPISLDYHPGGMRVEELPSWVGQGWALNAGGLITKTVIGLSDQMSNAGYLKNNYINLYNIITSPYEIQKAIFNSINQNALDLEPDKYYYNLNGNSGSFFIQKQTGKVFTMPKSNLAFNFPNSNIDSDGWEVRDSKGNRFLFGGNGFIETTHNENAGPSGSPNSFTATLLLRKVITVKGEEIDFIYQDYENQYYVRSGQSKKYLVGAGGLNGICPPISTNLITRTTLQNTLGKRIFKIKWAAGEIIFNKTTNNRQDILNDYALNNIEIFNEANELVKKYDFAYTYIDSYVGMPEGGVFNTFIGSKRLFLNEVSNVKEGIDYGKYRFEYNLSTSSSLPYYLSFSQDHWGYNNEAFNQSLIPIINNNYGQADRDVNTQAAVLGALKKIVYPTGGATEFEYESNVALIPKCDYMGSLNPNNRNKNEQFFSVTVNSTQLTNTIATPVMLCNEIDTKKYFEYVVNLATNINCPGAARDCTGNLQVFIYKQGGGSGIDLLARPAVNGQVKGTIFLDAGSTYTLQIDGPGYATAGVSATVIGRYNPTLFSFGVYGQPNTESYVNAKVGGLRIKEIINTDGIGKTEITKFFYNDKFDITNDNRVGYMTSGRMGKVPLYHYITQRNCGTGANGLNYQQILEISSSSTIQNTSEDDFRVGYKMVEMFKSDGNNKIKSFSYFTSYDEYWDEYNMTYPGVQILSNASMRGLLKSEKYLKYSSETATYSLIKNIENNYQVNESNTIVIDGLRNVCTDFKVIGGVNVPACETFFRRYFKSSKWPYLQSSIETDYSSNSTLSNEISYEYNHTYLLKTKQAMLNSKGTELVTTIKYPFDFTGNTIFTDMVNKNMLDYPIESANLLGTPLKELKKMVYTYGYSTDSKVIQLNKVESSIGGQGLITELDFKYDNFTRKISQLSKRDGSIFSYLYGYKAAYPIAEVVGVTYDQLLSTSGINLDVLRNQALNENALNIEVNKIRAVNGSYVNSYIYKPLIGIKAHNDQRGNKTTYEYDRLGRLMHLKDQNGNIIKKYCYNYAGQPIDCKPTNNTIGIYAKVCYEQTSTFYEYVYGNVVVRFYSDEACTIPISVSNLVVTYNHYFPTWESGSSSMYPLTATANGVSLTLATNICLSGVESREYYENGEWITVPYSFSNTYYLINSSQYNIGK